MEGLVKWFSQEKGYGFATPRDGEDHFFAVQDVKGADLPRTGDTVQFDSHAGSKGPRARNVQIIHRAATPATSRPYVSTDDRIACPRCAKRIVPRIITNRGTLSHSVCPFCGGTVKNFRWCFIATAVYGDVDSPQVVALRRFRDQHLCLTRAGRLLIRSYYRVSPRIAAFLLRHQLPARATRRALDCVVAYLVRVRGDL